MHFHLARKNLELFFSVGIGGARDALQSVTWNRSEENANSEVVSVNWLGDEDNFVDLSAERTTAYGSDIYLYDVRGTCCDDSYLLEVDSLASSYPSICSHREFVTARLAHSVILAKHSGVEKLRRIKRYYEQYQMPKWVILRKALKLYLKQTVCRRKCAIDVLRKAQKTGINVQQSLLRLSRSELELVRGLSRLGCGKPDVRHNKVA